MPTYFRRDDKPIVHFDTSLEISPFTLFRRLREGRPPELLDVRESPGEVSLQGARRWGGESWQPESGLDYVLFDEDGSLATEIAGTLVEQGHTNVKALFGGLDLYAFALDPQVVGEETYLTGETSATAEHTTDEP
jgi:hypothetical protein